MEKTSDPMPTLRSLSDQSRSLLLATVVEAAQLWRQTGSLAAYQVIVSALDSNDDEVRSLAESCLNRNSPRPNKCGAHQTKIQHWSNLSDGRSQPDGKRR